MKQKNYNLLFCGPPASAKTLFLLGILQCRYGVYFDGLNTTNRIRHLPRYTKERFLDLAVKVCPKLREATSCIIGEESWKQGSKDIHVIGLGKLLRKGDGPEEIEGLVKTLAKYTDV